MSLEQIWAPWRLAYIKRDSPVPAGTSTGAEEKPSGSSAGEPAAKTVAGEETPSGCFLCRYVAEAADRRNLVVARRAHTVVVLNRYPYNNGHLLIAPLEHKATLAELNDEELLECGQLLREFSGVLGKAMSPDGFNAGLNLGRVAGAGLPGHLHWHLVPRWNGDTNFMPIVAETNVIPQSLDALYELLTATSDEAG